MPGSALDLMGRQVLAMTDMPLIEHGATIGAKVTSPHDEHPLPHLEAVIDAAMASLRIAVLFSGDPSKPDSVINPQTNVRGSKCDEESAIHIADSLRTLGFRHVLTMPEDMHLSDRLRRDAIQLAWINSSGVQGYNPLCHAPAQLELLGIPYIGHDTLNASTLDNKHMFKRSLVALGLSTPPFITWHMARGAFRPKINSRFIRSFRNHWGAFIVKPVCGRGSMNVHVVDEERDLPDAVAEVFRATGNHVLIEAFLPGPEYCVALSAPVVARGRRLHGRADPFIFSLVQRNFADDALIVTPSEAVSGAPNCFRCLTGESDEAVRIQLYELARAVYLDFNLEGPALLDVRGNSAGALSILEGNLALDLKRPNERATSLICGGLEAEGMNYDDLVLTIFAGRIANLQDYRPSALPPCLRMT